MSTPTLQTYYREKVVPGLQAKHAYKNVHQIPRLEKIVVTSCMGKHPDRKQAVEDAVNEKGRYMGIPSLCVEILSKSTRSKDMVDKLNTYMLSGVREFWIVDPQKRTVLLYGFKDFAVDEYRVYQPGDTLVSYFFEGLEIALEEIFGAGS